MKLVIGISGASGAIYPFQILSYLKEKTTHEVSVIASSNGRRIFKEEIGKDLEGTVSQEMGFPLYATNNFDVPFVSGSAHFDAMIVLPCSMGTLGRIAHGVSNDSLTRAADVFIKEKRKLILVPRDTPFSLIHIENMRLLSLAGVTIIPAIPSFYSHPKTLEEVAATVTSRILDHIGIENDLMKRWKS